MNIWIRWWRYWSFWRVFLIAILAIGFSFLSAYFLPGPWGWILAIIIALIGQGLLRKYIPEMVSVLFNDVESQAKDAGLLDEEMERRQMEEHRKSHGV